MTTATTHIAAARVTLNERYVRQRCGWCGVVLMDYDLTTIMVPVGQDGVVGGWPEGGLVAVDGGVSWLTDLEDGKLPASACARKEGKA